MAEKEEKAGKPVEKVEKGKPEKAKEKKKAEQIIRFMETTIDGNKPVNIAIRRIKGISFMLSNAVAQVCDFEGKKMGDLTEQEMKRLEEVLSNPGNFGIPVWMFNRRKDPKSGEIRHLTVSNLEFTNKMDINEMKKIRCYKGVRHAAGLPLRGQRTRSSFRKGKTVGVSRAKGRQPGGKS